MSLSAVVFAGATDTQAPSPADAAAALAVETALRQPMDAQTHEALMQNETFFEQVLVDEEITYTDGQQDGVIRSYEFVPKYQMRASANSYLMREYITRNNDPEAYARHYADFMYDYVGKVSCFENYVITNMGITEVEFSLTGNGTKKSQQLINSTI